MKYCPECGTNLETYFDSSKKEDGPSPAKGEQQELVLEEVEKTYDQDAVWRTILTQAAGMQGKPTSDQVVRASNITTLKKAIEKLNGAPFSTIVHMLFDREIVPKGGFLYRAAMTDGRAGHDIRQLESAGYYIKDGKVQMQNDVPVGKAWRVLRYWGGERQYRRWHMSAPVTLEAARLGNPFFMDDRAVAFGASWKDDHQLYFAFRHLCDLFQDFEGQQMAVPLVIKLALQ